MAEAARSVKHYVSDCLAERHPYDAQKAFAGRAARDAGRVFDGHVPAGGIDNLVSSLADASVSDEEHARAARLLYSHSASQEVKIVLVQKGLVPVVVSLLNRHASCMLHHQCFLLLWSLSVVPQGCYAIVRCGGVEAALRAVAGPPTASGSEAEQTQVRVAAASAIAQTAKAPAGLRWVLQAEDCSEFMLPSVEYPLATPYFPPSASTTMHADGSLASSPEALMSVLTVTIQEEPLGESKVALHCATALAELTSIAPGVHLVTTGTLRVTELGTTLAGQLEQLAPVVAGSTQEGTPATPASMTPALSYLVQLLTVTWNIAMDQKGVELLDEARAQNGLFALFRSVKAAGPQRVPTLVQRTLMGALSAVSKLTSVKLASTNALEETDGSADPRETGGGAGGTSRVVGLLQYLREVNALVEAAKSGGRQPGSDLVAMSKNTVQCIRLASEVKAVRNITHAFLDQLDQVEGSHEGFYFRRQLYCATPWEAEYHASV